MTWVPSVAALAREMVRVAHLVSAQGLARSTDGNLSARLPDGNLLVTPGGVYKPGLTPEQLLVVDPDGRLVEGPEGLAPTSELPLHLAVYWARPTVGAVIHAHPPFATALTLVGLPFPVDLLPEVIVGLGGVPTLPYAPPGSTALAEGIADSICGSDALLLSHHGSLTVGRTLEAALIVLERLEHAAKVIYLARTLGGVIPLPPEEVERLRRQR